MNTNNLSAIEKKMTKYLQKMGTKSWEKFREKEELNKALLRSSDYIGQKM